MPCVSIVSFLGFWWNGRFLAAFIYISYIFVWQWTKWHTIGNNTLEYWSLGHKHNYVVFSILLVILHNKQSWCIIVLHTFNLLRSTPKLEASFDNIVCCLLHLNHSTLNCTVMHATICPDFLQNTPWVFCLVPFHGVHFWYQLQLLVLHI